MRCLRCPPIIDGLFSTVLEEDEIVLPVHFPLSFFAAAGSISATSVRYALVGGFVVQSDGSVREVTYFKLRRWKSG